MSQEELALGIGMDRTAIAQIESGRRGVTLFSMDKLAKGLKTTIAALVEVLKL